MAKSSTGWRKSRMSSTVQRALRADGGVDARPAASAPARGVIGALAPVMAVVLVAYLVIGLAMPVLPLYVHQARIPRRRGELRHHRRSEPRAGVRWPATRRHRD